MIELPKYIPPEDMTSVEAHDIKRAGWATVSRYACHPDLPNTHDWKIRVHSRGVLEDGAVEIGFGWHPKKRDVPDGSVELFVRFKCANCDAWMDIAAEAPDFQFDRGCDNCGEPLVECECSQGEEA